MFTRRIHHRGSKSLSSNGKTMKNKILPILLFFYVIFCLNGNLMACHEEDTNLQGHKSKWSFNGISSATEWSTALSSTTTLCDTYTGFLMRNYDQIAEEVSKGEGDHLEVLALYRGCSRKSFDSFKNTLKDQYDELFIESDLEGMAFLQRFENLMKQDPFLSLQCLLVPEASLS